MFKSVTPESVGVKSQWIKNLINHIENKGISAHDILLMRGNEIFCEAYWKPFNKDFLHRQYSQTKSFVGVAIGLLEEEGKLHLDDKIADYFRDKIDGELHEYLENQTIRDMLTMTTCCDAANWFVDEDKDRVHLYFNKTTIRYPAGTRWAYDSPGSQVLCVLVERLAGKPMLEYLKEKIFNHIGSFQNACILKTPTGESWGDSAMVCTPRDMLSFGRFVMNYGTWNGKRLMNEKYLKEATSALVYNNSLGQISNQHVGYGYQIWRVKDNAFAFIGMGQQLTICVPDKDIIFVCNCDNQGAYYPYDMLINYVFDEIIDRVEVDSLPENIAEQSQLKELCSNLKLRAIKGKQKTQMQDKVNGKTFVVISQNPQKITEFSLTFDEQGGTFEYVNEQGKKQLPFLINENKFTKFPQLGYSDEYGTLPTTNGFMYDCAVSATWVDDKQFQIYVQIIDKYFGNCTINFAFKGDMAVCYMAKTAEAFLNEYQGEFIAKLKD